MRKLCRTALLAALAIVSIPPANFVVPCLYAAAVPAAASSAKKKNKARKARKQKILKGRHTKHAPKPA